MESGGEEDEWGSGAGGEGEVQKEPSLPFNEISPQKVRGYKTKKRKHRNLRVLDMKSLV